jgi:hypothetical protein
MLDAGLLHSGPTIIALQWLVQNCVRDDTSAQL